MDLVPSLRSAYKRLQGVARCEAVYVTGPPSSGKTTLVRKLFEDKHKEYLHAYIDCYSIKNQAQLSSEVCQAFHSTMDVRRSRASKSVQRLPEPGAPVSLNDFYEAILEYRKLAYDKGYKRIFIVLDQVEEFDYTTLIETLVALVRYNMLDIRLIMISCEHPSDAFHAVTRKSPSIGFSLQDRCQVVCCSAWTVDDITSWILQAPPKQRVDLYRKFVANVVTLVFTTETKDPMMIRMYCQEHFEDFIIYYKKRRRETVLKKLALDPNSSEITDKELDDCEKQGVFDANLLVGNFLQTFKLLVHKSKDDNSKWKSSDTATRLTKNSAVLIVAAYIAAYTKPSDDKWNFIRYQRRKTSSRGKTDNHHDHHNRVFPLERLVQIYFELMKKATGDETLNFIENNDGVLADIERFKNLNILQHHSGFQFCSEARYKLSGIIKPDYVAKIAENNGLELSMFQGLPESFSTTK